MLCLIYEMYFSCACNVLENIQGTSVGIFYFYLEQFFFCCYFVFDVGFCLQTSITRLYLDSFSPLHHIRTPRNFTLS